MTTATILLLLIGALGACDIAYFHTYRGRLVLRPECRGEAFVHVARGYVYTALFLALPNVRLHGWYCLGLGLLYAVDALVALLDVLCEPRSRAAQGGLSGGEYLMHMVLGVLVGAMLHSVGAAAWADWALPTGIAPAGVPAPLRVLALLMAAGSAAVATLELLALLEPLLPPPAPLHVRVRLRAPLERVWDVTQDHRLHPRWDHRFSRIEMLHEAQGAHAGPLGTPDPRIGTGTLMRYEKRLPFLSITGFGRYKLHRPMRQSTFEFGSEDPRSLIRRGVGLWLYTRLGAELTELSTSYTYEVRWGVIGRIVDRYLFRPLFQRYTEQSFRRLARRFFGQRALVLGRRGPKPERFMSPAQVRARLAR